jgi:hypothetical protein
MDNQPKTRQEIKKRKEKKAFSQKHVRAQEKLLKKNS